MLDEDDIHEARRVQYYVEGFCFITGKLQSYVGPITVSNSLLIKKKLTTPFLRHLRRHFKKLKREGLQGHSLQSMVVMMRVMVGRMRKSPAPPMMKIMMVTVALLLLQWLRLLLLSQMKTPSMQRRSSWEKAHLALTLRMTWKRRLT